MSLLIPNHHPINPDGLVLWLDYKNTGSVAATGTWKDYSGNGNDGTLVADAYVDNNGVNLDGDNDSAELSTSNTQGQSTITITAWIKATTISKTNTIYYESTSTDAVRGRFALSVTQTNQLRLAGRDDDGGDFEIWAVSSDSVIGVNTWYHVVGVYDSTTGNHKVYLNGSDVTNTGSGGTNPLDSGNSLYAAVGALPGATPFEFTGVVDAVQLYTRALSVGEIQGLYQRTLRA